MPYSIMLDAGHGGTDPGAVSGGRQEKDDTLRLTLAIGEILQNSGRLRDAVPESHGGKRGRRGLFCIDPSELQPHGESVYGSREPGL